MVEKSCESCGEKFDVIPSRLDRAKYCSRECYDAGRKIPREQRTCEKCGESFTVKESSEQRFCSKSCSTSYVASQRPSGEDNPLWNREEVECAGCGSTFTVKKYRKEKNTHCYCSTECMRKRTEIQCEICGETFEVIQSEAERRRTCSYECMGKMRSIEYTGEDSPAWKGGDVEKNCAQCGKDIIVPRHRKDGNRFCSIECYGQWRTENLRGENNPKWRGGSSDYGPLWEVNKRKAKRRDDYTCYTCSITQDMSVALYNWPLEVHHVVPHRISEDNSLSNLITLCVKCHRRLEGKTHRE